MPAELSRRVTDFAVRHQGPGAASSVTRVVAWGQDVERRQSSRPAPRPVGWTRVQPYLILLVVVFVGVVVTLILLQSAGTIHLPLLGGSGSGAGALGAWTPQNSLTAAMRLRRSLALAGPARPASSSISRSIDPATFIRPCMKATLGSRLAALHGGGVAPRQRHGDVRRGDGARRRRRRPALLEHPVARDVPVGAPGDLALDPARAPGDEPADPSPGPGPGRTTPSDSHLVMPPLVSSPAAAGPAAGSRSPPARMVPATGPPAAGAARSPWVPTGPTGPPALRASSGYPGSGRTPANRSDPTGPSRPSGPDSGGGVTAPSGPATRASR